MLWGHATLPGLPGAYVFIDTFFVISGYLVSQSLIRAMSPATAGGARPFKQPLLVFFSNRFRRIVIPLAATVLLTLVAGWFILMPDDFFKLAQAARATLFLQAHTHALTLGSYFDVVDGNAPLLHAWSLSLEEWFYIITPILVVPALLWSRLWWGLVLAALALLSLYTAQTMSADPESLGASYNLFQTRVWQFMAGAICAILIQQPPALGKLANDGLIVLGLVGVFASVLVLTDKAASPGFVTLPAVIGMLAVLILSPRSRALQVATGSAAVRYLGQRQYSLYLVHYPVMVYFDYLDFDFGALTDPIKFLIALAVSLGFYYAVEAPAKGWRAIAFPKVAVLSGVLIAASLGLSGHVLKTGGVPTRLPDMALVAWTARYDTSTARADCLQGQLTRFGYSCAFGPQGGPYFALFGDSHSEVYAAELARVLEKRGIGLRHYWYAECPAVGPDLAALGVFSDACGKLSLEAHRAVMADANLAGVIYAARWPWYLNDADAERLRAQWRGADGVPRNHATMEAFRAAFGTVLARSVAAFTARNVAVYLVSPVPSLGVDPVKAQVLTAWYRRTPGFDHLTGGIALESYRQDRAAFDDLIAGLPSEAPFTLIEVQDALCDAQSCGVYGDTGSLYYDDNHLNEAGARKVIRTLLDSAPAD